MRIESRGGPTRPPGRGAAPLGCGVTRYRYRSGGAVNLGGNLPPSSPRALPLYPSRSGLPPGMGNWGWVRGRLNHPRADHLWRAFPTGVKLRLMASLGEPDLGSGMPCHA